jgi:hypothetical protein
MRPRRVAVGVALIVTLTLVVVPGVAGRLAGREQVLADEAFRPVTLPDSGTSMAILPDPYDRSAGSLAAAAVIVEAQPLATLQPRPVVADPRSVPVTVQKWHLDSNISWYGPGFYGNAGACGMMGSSGMTEDTVGVAHRTLPCGTKVTFRYQGWTVTTMVIDRGPYVSGRTWDMTHGLCELLHHCFTGGGVYWHLG